MRGLHAARAWGVGFGMLCIGLSACTTTDLPTIATSGITLYGSGNQVGPGQVRIHLTSRKGVPADTTVFLRAAFDRAQPVHVNPADSVAAVRLGVLLRGKNGDAQSLVNRDVRLTLNGAALRFRVLSRNADGSASRYVVAASDTSEIVVDNSLGSSTLHISSVVHGDTVSAADVQTGPVAASMEADDGTNCLGEWLTAVGSSMALAGLGTACAGTLGFFAPSCIAAIGAFAVAAGAWMILASDCPTWYWASVYIMCNALAQDPYGQGCS